MVPLQLTSFTNNDLNIRHPGQLNMPIRKAYLPIDPSNPHPDNSILLHLHPASGTLRKKSYVRMNRILRVPVDSLTAYNLTPGMPDPYLSGESFEELVQYCDDHAIDSWMDHRAGQDAHPTPSRTPRPETPPPETPPPEIQQQEEEEEEEGWQKVRYKRRRSCTPSQEPSPLASPSIPASRSRRNSGASTRSWRASGPKWYSSGLNIGRCRRD